MASSGDPLPTIGIAFIGHQGSGKSTVIGRLLYDCGGLSDAHKQEVDSNDDPLKKFSQLSLLAGKKEQEAGETIENHLAYFNTDKYQFGLIDVPGRHNFIRNMITGASLADVAVLVVPAGEAEFEASISRGTGAQDPPGEARQHSHLVKLMGIDQLIVLVNHMDQVGYSEDRFNAVRERLDQMLRKIGFATQRVAFIPTSGLNGENITGRSDLFDLQWYKGFNVTVNKSAVEGFTLLDALNNVVQPPTRNTDAPIRLPVWQNYSKAKVVSGRLEQGTLGLGTSVKLFPSGASGVVNGIKVQETDVEILTAGNIGSIKLEPLEGEPKVGDVVFSNDDPEPPRLAKSFTALIYVVNSVGKISKGTQFQVVIRTGRSTWVLDNIDWKLGSSTDNKKLEGPENLDNNDQAQVTFVSTQATHPLAVQSFQSCQALGRFGGLQGSNLTLIGRVMNVEYAE